MTIQGAASALTTHNVIFHATHTHSAACSVAPAKQLHKQLRKNNHAPSQGMATPSLTDPRPQGPTKTTQQSKKLQYPRLQAPDLKDTQNNTPHKGMAGPSPTDPRPQGPTKTSTKQGSGSTLADRPQRLRTHKTHTHTTKTKKTSMEAKTWQGLQHRDCEHGFL